MTKAIPLTSFVNEKNRDFASDEGLDLMKKLLVFDHVLLSFIPEE